ncbi:MAG: serine hydrolase [Bacteroidales bacterium]|nr:serine hydrolase [Bacteroidales bacterium]
MKIILKKSSFVLILVCLSIISCTEKQVSTSLPRSTPEAEGVSSRAIITFLDSAATSVHEFHSFMFLRHGKVIAEGWWDPLGPDLKHTLYSTSKSFTATAIGFAESENKLSLDDKVISFFPESLPDSVSPFLEELTIRHMLSMTVGQGRERSAPSYTTDDWIKAFLAIPMAHKPGTTYMYNSMASYMLSAIVQKVTGEKVIDYLTPRLFEPLGIEGADWETDSDNINTGGWGLRLKTEDLAKFGQLYLDKGKWNGKQLLPEKWVEEATSLKIYQNPGLSDEERESSDDSVQGYCYQFWRARNNSYMANGAFGQFVLVIPEKDAVIVFTAESQQMWAELDMAWKYLVPGIKDEKLPEDNMAYDELKRKQASLAIPAPPKNENEVMASQISGKTITLSENQSGLQSLNLQFRDNLCIVNMKTGTDSYDISFGSGKWHKGETTRHPPSIFATAQNSLGGLPPFKIAAAYSWLDTSTLELVLRYIDAMHTEKILLTFDKNKVNVDLTNSIGRGRPVSIEGNI